MGKPTLALVVVSLSLSCGLDAGPMGPGAGGGSVGGGSVGGGTSGPTPNPSARHDEVTSGSRLKARRLKGSDGSEMFVGWWDSKLQRDCGFGIAADGATRCLPVLPRRIAETNESYFSDAQCTQRLGELVTSGSCSGDALPNVQVWPTTALSSGSTCKVPASRVMVINQRLPESAVIYELKAGVCQAGLLSAAAAAAGYFLVSEIPPTDFLAVDVVVDP